MILNIWWTTTYLPCSSDNTILTTIYFTSWQLGTRLPTELRTFLLWVTPYATVSVTRTSQILKKLNCFCILLPYLFWMRQDLIVILYFLSFAILILLLGPGYLLNVVQLMQLIKELNDHIWMPHPINQKSVVWNTLSDDGFDEIQHFNCPWTITTSNESITVKIT